MNITKMRIGVNSENKKVMQVLRQNGGKMEIIHDFRKCLIKDGVVQNGILVRELIVAASTTSFQNNGYQFPYSQMVSNGEIEYDESGGYLRIPISKLNVGNSTYGVVVPNIFLTTAGVLTDSEKYANYKLHIEAKYYADKISESSSASEISLNGSPQYAWGADPDADFCEKTILMSRAVNIRLYNKNLNGVTIELRNKSGGLQRSTVLDGSEKFLIKNVYFTE